MDKILKLLPGAQKNISLENYTTFKIGGRAKYFFVAKTKIELIKTIQLTKKLKLPFFVFGGGSNLLISDKGFDGLVIKVLNTKYKIPNTKIVAEAGVMLEQLVRASADARLSGMEWAAGIPGTVGGAIYGNAGAFGKSMKDIVESVEVLDVEKINPPKFCETKLRRVKNKDCKFNYRDSIFKKNKNLIIISAEIKLKKGNKNKIKQKIKEYLKYKKETQPLNYPSAGSVFKNPLSFKISKKFRMARGFSAGELIDRCGLKGKKIGNIKISEKHANFIVNLGGGRAEDVKKLINLAKKSVKNKFGVILEEEIQYLS